jgi:hypothetical protein
MVMTVLRVNSVSEKFMNWKLSPSDLVFLYEECPRCFYLKVRGLENRPKTQMPKIFTTIDAQMKSFLRGQRTDGLAIGMPKGTFRYAKRWVESAPIAIPGRISSCYFRGRFDNILELDTGGHALADLKTCHRRDEHVPLYARQLHAYTWCLEHPSPGALHLSPIERMGLLVFEPDFFLKLPFWSGALSGGLHWIEIRRDDNSFLDFIAELVCLLDRPTAPDPAFDCPWCRYRSLPVWVGPELPRIQ